MNQLLENISNHIKLSEELKIDLTRRTSIESFKKGDIIHDAKDICRYSYFIEKGILRLYFIKDGKAISEFFASTKEWINSPKSFIQQKVDHYYIDVIEDCRLISLSVDDLMYLFDHFPEMEKYARMDMGSTFGHLMERITSLRFTTAKEKYIHFCETYSHIYHKIPLGMVASYLGIAPETLSRIRKQK